MEITIYSNPDDSSAVSNMRKFIEEEFTRTNIIPNFRVLLESVQKEDRTNFVNALKLLTAENAIPYLVPGFLWLENDYTNTYDWETADDDYDSFIEQVSGVISRYQPSLLQYISERKGLLFAQRNHCTSYEIPFDILKSIDTKLFLFCLRASGFEDIQELKSAVDIGKLKHTVCSVFYSIFSRLDMDNEYNSVEKLCHLLTSTIDDFIEGFPLQRGSFIQCLNEVIFIKYDLKISNYSVKEDDIFADLYYFESEDFWGFDFSYSIDFKQLAIDILDFEGYSFK